MTHHDCYNCKDTGLCPKCGGQGCMDCRYTGECQQCRENEQDELFFIRSRAHERYYNRRQSEYFD